MSFLEVFASKSKSKFVGAWVGSYIMAIALGCASTAGFMYDRDGGSTETIEYLEMDIVSFDFQPFENLMSGPPHHIMCLDDQGVFAFESVSLGSVANINGELLWIDRGTGWFMATTANCACVDFMSSWVAFVEFTEVVYAPFAPLVMQLNQDI